MKALWLVAVALAIVLFIQFTHDSDIEGGGSVRETGCGEGWSTSYQECSDTIEREEFR